MNQYLRKNDIHCMFFLLISFLFLLVIFVPTVNATPFSKTISETVNISDSVSVPPTINWSASQYSPGDAPAGAVVKNVITVKDLNSRGAGSINILVTSHRSPTGTQIQLSETPPNSATFKNTNIIFTNGTGEIPLGTGGFTKVTFSFHDDDANCDPLTAETIPGVCPASGAPVTITSSSDLTGITPNFTETGINTSIFSAQITLTTGPSGGTSLHVADGDEISMLDGNTGTTTNWLITPNPNPTIGDISVFTSGGDIVSASYKGVTKTATIGDDSCPSGPLCGGGGGGVVTNGGLVLDFVSILSGGNGGGSSAILPSLFAPLSSLPQNLLKTSSPNPSAPISPSTDSSISYPLVIDGKKYLLTWYANTLVTSTEETNKLTPIEFHFHTNGYPITHVSLFFDKGQGGNMQESDTAIIFDRDYPLKIIDPHRYFGNVTVSQSQSQFTANFTFNIIFSKSMPKSDLMTRVWNQWLSAQDMSMYDALQVVNNTLQISNKLVSTSPNTISNNSTRITQPMELNQNTTQSENQTVLDNMTSIKEWGGYSPQSISDSQLLTTLKVTGQHIPPWVMKITKFVVNSEIGEKDFENIIKYLSQKGIIR